MLYKNNYQPAYAAAHSGSNVKKPDGGFVFSASNSEANDFNSFGGGHSSSANKKRNPAPQKRKKKKAFDLKAVVIAAASVVAFILLITLIVAVANSGGKHLTFKNNTFVSYEQNDRYFVAMNGEVIGSGFENEITLTPAKDNSFAYVTEDTPEGFNIYVLEKKELTQVVTSPVSEVVAFADYKPGIVYRDENKYFFYASDNEERITTDKTGTASNFLISPDATAVVYTMAEEENVNENKLYLYVNGIPESYASNMIPVAVANGGEYIYAYGITSADYITKKLYVITPENNDKISIETGFDKITYINTTGDEIMYTVGAVDTGYQSYIYSVKKAKSFKIGAGICVPVIADKSVAALSSLKDIVVENTLYTDETRALSATYYVNKKFESSKLSTYNGSLNSSGNFFYFINSENTLTYIDLDDKNRTAEKVAEGVVEFVITEKDNIYYLDDDGRLMFYKASTAKKNRIADDVVNMSINSYSNILYFEIEEDTKAYYTEEGSGKEIAKFAKQEILTAPEFTDVAQKKTFAYVRNADTDLYDIYYTTTGTTYKLIATDCVDITSVEDPFEDIISDPEPLG